MYCVFVVLFVFPGGFKGFRCAAVVVNIFLPVFTLQPCIYRNLSAFMLQLPACTWLCLYLAVFSSSCTAAMEGVLVVVVNRKQGNQSVSENPSSPCSTLLHAKRKKTSPQLVDLQTNIAKDTTDPTVECFHKSNCFLVKVHVVWFGLVWFGRFSLVWKVW